jgi:hypothetical protein
MVLSTNPMTHPRELGSSRSVRLPGGNYGPCLQRCQGSIYKILCLLFRARARCWHWRELLLIALFYRSVSAASYSFVSSLFASSLAREPSNPRTNEPGAGSRHQETGFTYLLCNSLAVSSTFSASFLALSKSDFFKASSACVSMRCASSYTAFLAGVNCLVFTAFSALPA